MALKPTIYKFDLQIADLDNGRYEDCSETVALHPSETLERMMVRILVFGLNYRSGLQFTKGLSTQDEPDLWRHADDGQLVQWIELGQASVDRIRKGVSRAQQVDLYAYGKEKPVWWTKTGDELSRMPKLSVYAFNWEQVSKLPELVERSMSLSLTITDGHLMLASDRGVVELDLEVLTTK